MTIRSNNVAQKTSEVIVLFHKKTTKLDFLWPNIGQLCFKVLSLYIKTTIRAVIKFIIFQLIISTISLYKNQFNISLH